MRRISRRGSVTLAAVLLAAAVAFPLGVVASHQFSDVPTTSSYHTDIDALADNGITTGCGGGKYCPKDFVTREQMAAFMNRLGALSAGKTPVVNASRVDGLDAASLTRVDGTAQAATIELPDAPVFAPYNTIHFNAPVDGFALVTGSATVVNNDCTSQCYVFGRLRFVDESVNSLEQQVSATQGNFGTMTIVHVFAVTEGFNTFELQLSNNPGTGGFSGYWGQLTVQFSPFGEATSLE